MNTRKKKKDNMKKAFLLAAAILSLASCKRACEDPKALNYSYDTFTKKDNSICEYSKAIFYVSGPANYPPLTLYIDGQASGTIGGFYPYGPGNCSATGCAVYQFTSGSKVDWEVRDAIGNTVNGTAEPSQFQECIKIKVY